MCPGRNDAPYAYQNDDCPKTISARKLDGYVNRALNDLLLHPEEVARAIDEEIQRRGSDEEMVAYQVSVEQIEGELAAMPVQRDWVITMARTRKITEAEMEVQLRELEATKVALQKELREKQSPVENLNQLRELAKNIGEFLSRLDVEEDLLSWDEIMASPEEARAVLFDGARRMVDQFVDRVVVHRGEIDVILKFDLRVTRKEMDFLS